VLASSEPSDDVDTLLAAARALPFPLFVKAVAGGGRRGMRRVQDPADLAAAVQAAMREAESAFGDPTVLRAQAAVEPRRIEAQLWSTRSGTWSTCSNECAGSPGRKQARPAGTGMPAIEVAVVVDSCPVSTRDELSAVSRLLTHPAPWTDDAITPERRVKP
jgi:hypothetical protein